MGLMSMVSTSGDPVGSCVVSPFSSTMTMVGRETGGYVRPHASTLALRLVWGVEDARTFDGGVDPGRWKMSTFGPKN